MGSMTGVCTLCTKSAARQDCYVRIEQEERPTCRPCWEQLLLDPKRVIRSLQELQSGRSLRGSSAS
jgi:hypothetical protein